MLWICRDKYIKN